MNNVPDRGEDEDQDDALGGQRHPRIQPLPRPGTRRGSPIPPAFHGSMADSLVLVSGQQYRLGLVAQTNPIIGKAW